MAMNLERDPQLESILAGRRQQLGITMDFAPGRRLGQAPADVPDVHPNIAAV
ncbi:hypothetical protein [Aureimonas populi]|uniref:Uncharacterized protein n=1 Tax=Aureimonas populi TaxID=1701758 RepID=A0ABW5CLX9_9HYPH|nr:hypothetical protein [Aureimonas populi]